MLIVNWLVQRLYRLGYAAMRLVWFFTRPHGRAVAAVITGPDARVVMAMHSYGERAWRLPGGLLKAGEVPSTAIARELREELGLEVATATWIGRVRVDHDFRTSEVELFHVLAVGTELRPDRREITCAKWFDADRMPAPVADGTRQALDMFLKNP